MLCAQHPWFKDANGVELPRQSPLSDPSQASASQAAAGGRKQRDTGQQAANRETSRAPSKRAAAAKANKAADKTQPISKFFKPVLQQGQQPVGPARGSTAAAAQPGRGQGPDDKENAAEPGTVGAQAAGDTAGAAAVRMAGAGMPAAAKQAEAP